MSDVSTFSTGPDTGWLHRLGLVGLQAIEAPVLAHAREQYRALRAELGEQADYLDPIRAAEVAAGVELRG